MNEVRALQIVVDQVPQAARQGMVDADEMEYRRLHQQYRALYEQIVEVAKPMMEVQARIVEAMLHEKHPEWRGLAVSPVVEQWSDTLAMRLGYSFEGSSYLGYTEAAAIAREIVEYLECIG